jgi:arylsulfatase A-like enzyme
MEASPKRRPSMLLLAILVGAAGFGIARCSSERARTPGPALVLVTLDTFRADHLGCAGHPDVRTPWLDRLARRGVHWTEAVSAIPLTTPSHATILSGRSPRSHGLLKNRMRLADEVVTLPALLRDAGWATGAVVSSRLVLGPEFGLDRGFDHYEVVEPDRLPASGEGARTTEAARTWTRTAGGPESFLWVHYFDAHLPYLPPAPWDRLHLDDPDAVERARTHDLQATMRGGDGVDPELVTAQVALYASEVGFLDRCVGELIRAAASAETPTTFVVTADHGEGLYEHDRYFGHDILLYETSMRVPLVIASVGGDAARRAPGGVLSRDPARTVDVAPTLAGLAAVTGAFEGRDLLRDPAPTGDALLFVAETHPSREKATATYALRTDEHKVVWEPRERRRELYDLRTDPAERRDLSTDPPHELEVLAEDLELDLRQRPVGTLKTIDEESGTIDEHVREAMQSLGYVD